MRKKYSILSVIALLLLLAGGGFWVGLHFVEVKDYVFYCIEKVLRRSPFGIFLLFAPALLFDTTRYYITNTFYVLLRLFGLVDKEQKLSPSFQPEVSVIVPIYNEGENLRLTLNSILENNYPNFEVIVIDEGVSELTRQICQAYKARTNFRYIRKAARGGKPSSLNYGLKLANGEIMIHLDGDTSLERDAISHVVKKFQDSNIGAVSGNLRVANAHETLCTRFQEAEYGISINLQRRWLAATDMLQIASGGFSAFRKKLLLLDYGVDPEEGEDLDISLKIRKLGYKVAFAEKAIGYTKVPSGFSDLARQRMRWDSCYIRLNLRKHANISNPRHFRRGDFIAGVTDFLFNIILLVLFPAYMVYLYLYARDLIPFVLTVTLLFYFAMNTLQLLLVVLTSPKQSRDWSIVLLSPFLFFYNFYLKIVRVAAYIKELFSKKVVKNSYFPDSVWKQMPRKFS